MIARIALGLALLAVACATSVARAAEPPRPPNVVVLLADDLGYGDLGCYGAADISTPHIDALARAGARFTDFYVSQPVCTASRASLLTGYYAHRVRDGLTGALNHTSTAGVAAAEVLLPELCRDRGYATAIFGKWHLGHRPEFHPLRHGFDHFHGIPYSNDTSRYHPVLKGLPPLPLYEDERVVAEEPDQSLFTRQATDRAVAFIEAHAARPFFLYVPYVMPHVPIFATPPFRGRSARGPYGDAVEELDASVGEIAAALDRAGVAANTLVLFLSDNGPFLSYGNHAGSAGQLREGKLTTFEGGVRVPFIARWPGVVPAGRVCQDVTATIDIVPTVARLIGASLQARRVDGIDIGPLLRGETERIEPSRTYLLHAGDRVEAVRRGRWKLHLPHEYPTVGGEPGRDGRPAVPRAAAPRPPAESGLRGVASRHGYEIRSTSLALYDLAADPGETTNLADAHPDIVRDLEARAAAGAPP